MKAQSPDGISTGADVKISDKARVIINSEGGLGIAGRMVEIDGATVDSTGLYAGIDAHGLKIVNGAEVSCTSTANSAIWTKGDILIKGGAKVTTDGKYPMGGNGTFTVEEAEIDAKNTNENNIPAIFDESEIGRASCRERV